MAINISCQQATRLIEERADGPLPLKSAVGLTVHLLYCKYCKRYEAQSPLVAQLALFAGRHTAGNAEVQLSTAARLRIQQRLEAAQGGSGEN
jgi:hypothetical protein